MKNLMGSSRIFQIVVAALTFCLGAAAVQAATISVSTDILNNGLATPGILANGAGSTGAQVNHVRFIPLGPEGSYNAVPYTAAGATVNLSSYISVTGDQRGVGQNLHINGYSTGGFPSGNLYLRGEPNVSNPGFGAHANWLVTVDLNAVRTAHFGGSSDPLQLTGQFGTWGGIGDTNPNAGVIQGAIFLDGVRIDSMGKSVANPAESVFNPSFDLNISSGQYLTFAILNGSPSDTSPTYWDDGLFKNVNMTLIPEPSSLALLAFGLISLGLFRRQR